MAELPSSRSIDAVAWKFGIGLIRPSSCPERLRNNCIVVMPLSNEVVAICSTAFVSRPMPMLSPRFESRTRTRWSYVVPS